MPLEDSAAVRNAADAARYTGRAPSAEKAYLSGGDLIGQSDDIFKEIKDTHNLAHKLAIFLRA